MANHVLLENIELTQSAAAITFDNIPQTGYTDLKILIAARTSRASDGDYIYFSLNGAQSNSGRYLKGYSTATETGTVNDNYLSITSTNNTANSFSNYEILIPNYTSTTVKSISSDGVAENNSAGSNALSFGAFTWTSGSASTSAITSITLTGRFASFVSGSTFSLYGISAAGTTPLISPKATGGTMVTNDGTYWYHTFLASSTFTPKISLSCDILQIAGGGGGGNNWGGGGGAGGVLSFSSQSAIKNTNYSVVVGAGGAGSIPTSGSNGSNSQFGSLTASVGGGLGGSQAIGNNGGSGGGGSGAGYTSSYAGGSPTSGQGNSGGTSVYSGQVSIGGGGGGGAGGAGGNGGYFIGGIGGSPTSSYSTWASVTSTGVSGAYAGGGGGGSASSAGSATGGGAGDGANQGIAGTSAITNTGSGGGGGGSNSGPGGSGASGIVIVRYAM